MNDDGHDTYNVFIRDCISQLKETRYCYCYTLEQIEEIQKRCKEDLHIIKNECGYTLSIPRKELKNE